MGRRKTSIKGRRVAFSTRHMRAAHRDELRVLGDVMGLNMEEALDLALYHGLRKMRKMVAETFETPEEREERKRDPRAF